MEQTNLKIRKANEKDITFLYELINGLASYEKRPNDMTASIEDLKYILFKRHIHKRRRNSTQIKKTSIKGRSKL